MITGEYPVQLPRGLAGRSLANRPAVRDRADALRCPVRSPFPGYLLAVCLTLVVLTGHVYSNHARLLDGEFYLPVQFRLLLRQSVRQVRSLIPIAM